MREKGAFDPDDQSLARELDSKVMRLQCHWPSPSLMLTPGNVRDVKAGPTLLERAGRMRYLLGDKPVLRVKTQSD